MRKSRESFAAISIASAVSFGLIRIAASAQTVYFSTTAAGQTKSIPQWGVEVVEDSSLNMQQSIANMGANNIDIIATNFFVNEALQANGSIGPNSQAALNTQLSIAALAGNKPLVMGPNVGDTDPSYLSGSGINVSQWVNVLDATKNYFNSKGWTLADVMPFNEPDYWSGQGTQQQLYDVMADLKTDPNFSGVGLEGASTLDSDNALSWYNAISGVATLGSTHVLGGSATTYEQFFQQVAADGGQSAAPELHGLGEAIYAAEYGAQQGIWWSAVDRARGLFVQDSQGKQLGYAENTANDTAAAVYRGPDGSIRAFAGGFERTGTPTPYRFVITSGPVYFNGVGPISQYMIHVGQGGEGFADIQTSNPEPALDGNEWEIVNRATGQALEVAGGGTADGNVVNSATNTGVLYEKWNIIRNENGYYAFSNANSGLTMDVQNASLFNDAGVVQNGSGTTLDQQWYINPTGNGYYYIENANSNNYLTGYPSQAVQYGSTGSSLQQWQFVEVNPAQTGKLSARYQFEGNANDSTGANNGVVSGSPTYGPGPTSQSQAINLNGTNSYVTLPSGVLDSQSFTIAAWVKWNGGAAWQRIFDFGNNTTSYMFLTPDSGSNTMRFAITTGGSTSEEILDTDPLQVGQWVHLAVTLSGDTGVLYVNGAPTVAGQIQLNPSDIDPTLNYIGKSQYSGDPLFNGQIADFQIYNYALTSSQIAALAPVPLTWNNWSGNDQWDTASTNWTNGVADRLYGDGSAVTFNDSNGGTGGYAVTLNSMVKPGSITVNNSAGNYTISGSGSIGGTASLTKSGTGVFTIATVGTAMGAVSVSGGSVQLGISTGLATMTSLVISGNGMFDINNNHVIINYGGAPDPIASIAALLKTGYNGGGWNGAGGIISTAAQLNNATPGNLLYGIGYADSSDPGNPAALASGTIEVAYTLLGDANLKGVVDGTDFAIVAANFNKGVSGWDQGDFNYDNVVDGTDFGDLAANFNKGASGAAAWQALEAFAAANGLMADVPEPVAGGAALVPLIGALYRRRNRGRTRD